MSTGCRVAAPSGRCRRSRPHSRRLIRQGSPFRTPTCRTASRRPGRAGVHACETSPATLKRCGLARRWRCGGPRTRTSIGGSFSGWRRCSRWPTSRRVRSDPSRVPRIDSILPVDGRTIGRATSANGSRLYAAAVPILRAGIAARATSPAADPTPNRRHSAPAGRRRLPVAALPTAGGDFVAPCGACHATAERAPPNFLTGDAARSSRSSSNARPRIYVRLAMWQRPPGQWTKVPMPPPRASVSGHPWIQSDADPVVATLRQASPGWIRAEGKEGPTLEHLLEQGYENLRPCLPAAH